MQTCESSTVQTNAITGILIQDPEAWLFKNNVDFIADATCSIVRKGKNLDAGIVYYDNDESCDVPEADRNKLRTMADHIAALQKLFGLVDAKQLHFGGLTSVHLTDPCNWDAEVVDAYRQILYYGEVIYG